VQRLRALPRVDRQATQGAGLGQSHSAMFNQDQIDYLSSLHFINRIDEHLKIVSRVQILNAEHPDMMRVMLALEIYYHSHLVDDLSFDLHNYEYEEIIDIARNISSNEFIMYEVDMLLAGEVE
jgi:hypothetical protein